eukprot:scaffold5490_cov125-Cylindrotheca_fusiformis.AAC.3
MGDPEPYSEAFFAARIETLQNQIKDALPTVESSEAMSTFQKKCQVQWDAWAEILDLRERIKRSKGDQKDALNKEKKQKDKEYDAMMKKTWPDRIKLGNEFYDSEVDLAALEKDILECTVLIHSGPKQLAEFIAEKSKPQSLWDDFVSDPAYMKKVLVNGGAFNGRIPEALKLHKELRRTIEYDAPNEVREKLALAVALEFAVPKTVFKHGDQVIDPMERFWHYLRAYEGGFLDKNFETLSVWELRMVVDCDATNDELQWGKFYFWKDFIANGRPTMLAYKCALCKTLGREYLRRYRPDQVRTPCPHSKYLWSGRTDVSVIQAAVSGRPKLHEFEFYRDVISAGGPCGPNAFWGRFIINSFGLPTWGCWGTELGMNFNLSHWSENRWTPNKHERRGTDFDYDSRARINTSEDEYFTNVALLECVSDCLGQYLLEYIPSDQVWRSLAITRRQYLAEKNWVERPKAWNNKPLKNRGELLPTTPPRIEITETITWESGEAIIPSALMSSPDPSKFDVYHEFKDEDFPFFPGANYRGKDINIMTSWTGGHQVCFGFGNYWWEYTIPDSIPEGSYALSCKIVNVHRTQSPLAYIVVGPDGNESEKKKITIPYTVGDWMRTGHVMVDLKPGSKLKFSRDNGKLKKKEAGAHNLVIKALYLKPKDQLEGQDGDYVIVDK